jgi:putative spermidine/putrescine transport system ATP-binding protein
VQQIGTPEELHTRPANWHVADFMGYRNLLPMRTAADRPHAATVVVEGSGMRLVGTPVGDVGPDAEVVAGVRPEDLRIIEADGVPGTVEVVEYQGREVAVEARTAEGVALHLRTTGRPAPGDKVWLGVDPTRLLVFPADIGDSP